MSKPEAEVQTVTMTDGRLVDFAGKRRLIKESFVEDGKVKVRLDWRNGETRLFTVPDELLFKFAAHGAEQKLGDETAGIKGANGQEADIDDLVLAVDNLIDRLYDGEWTVKRASDGLAGTSVLLRALVEVYSRPVADIKAFLKDKTHAEKTALRQNPKIRPVIERLEAEKAAKAAKSASVDTDAILAGLEAAAE